jgi:hypothetical protein
MDSATKCVLFLLACSPRSPSYDDSHTVEELQQFANMHTPAGPSSHVVRLTVPQSCCAEAARVLVRAFGGEDEARRVVGGVRWWQVRPGDGGYVVCLFPSGWGTDGCVRVYVGSTRSGSRIKGTGRRRSDARRLLLRQRRHRRPARVRAGASLPSLRRPRHH